MPEKLTIAQLQCRQEYLTLTTRQRKLVEVFVATGDRLTATREAYTGRTDEIIRVRAYQVFSNNAVIACLAVANGEDPDRAVFLEKVERATRSKKTTVAEIQALRLLGQARGYIGSKPQQPEAQSETEVESKPKRTSSKADNPNREFPPQDLENLYGM